MYETGGFDNISSAALMQANASLSIEPNQEAPCTYVVFFFFFFFQILSSFLLAEYSA